MSCYKLFWNVQVLWHLCQRLYSNIKYVTHVSVLHSSNHSELWHFSCHITTVINAYYTTLIILLCHLAYFVVRFGHVLCCFSFLHLHIIKYTLYKINSAYCYVDIANTQREYCNIFTGLGWDINHRYKHFWYFSLCTCHSLLCACSDMKGR